MASHRNLLRQGLSQNLELIPFGPREVLWPASLSDASACAYPSARVTGSCGSTQLCMWVFEIQTQVLMIVQQVLLST